MTDPSTPRTRASLGRVTTLAAITALVAGAGLPSAMVASAATLTPQRVGGDLGQLPDGAVKAADPADSTPVNLNVSLALRDEAGAQALAAAVGDPTSAEYHHYLGTGEFAQRFGADAATVAKVTQALKDAGLTVGALKADGTTLPVSTTIGAAKKAFNIGVAGYRLADGTTGFRATQAPAVRGDVAGLIEGVTGLNTLAKPQAHHAGVENQGTVASAANAQAHAATTAAYPHLCQSVSDVFANNPKGPRLDGRDYYSPASLAQVYHLDHLNDGGAGATVAIFSLESFSGDALKSYQSCLGTNTSVTTVPVDMGTPAPADGKNVGIEAALDIDTIVGLAPKANVLFYEGKDAAQASDADVINTYQQIVTDNKADVISSSWGGCDYVQNQSTLKAENKVFLQAALQGMSVVAAAGDDGSTDCTRSTNDPVAQKHISADDPASQPFVTGVGGTTLKGVANPTESIWNHDHSAGGGGESTFWQVSKQNGFQAGFTAPGYNATRCGLAVGDPLHACRQTPDVSADADPKTGYPVAIMKDMWIRVGGTSAAAPLWGAISAHMNAQHKCSGRVGNLAQPLYAAERAGKSPLTDVTVGNNDVDGQQNGLYVAAKGYDMASGLGTPKADELVNALCAPAAKYVPVAPKRLLDTRVASHKGQVAGQGTVNLKVAGQGGVPTTGVSAVVLNTTVTDTAAAGYLTAYPAGAQRPLSSNLNWTQGGVVPNLVTVPVSADGTVSLFNGSWSSADFVADVQGYYTTEGTGSELAPLAPTRLLDTRDHSGHGTVKAHGSFSLPVAGKGNVPADATAAVLNVTVADTASAGYLTAYPAGVAQPLASNLNWTAGQVVPNSVIVPIGKDGNIEFYNGSLGATDVIVDIAGYFSASTEGGNFHAVNPTRQIDTRQGHGALTNGKVLSLGLHTANARIPFEATSAVLNVTVTNTTASGYLTAWAHGGEKPLASNLNWVKGNTIANQVTVPVHDGQIDLAAFGYGTTDVVVDLFGYYSN